MLHLPTCGKIAKQTKRYEKRRVETLRLTACCCCTTINNNNNNSNSSTCNCNNGQRQKQRQTDSLSVRLRLKIVRRDKGSGRTSTTKIQRYATYLMAARVYSYSQSTQPPAQMRHSLDEQRGANECDNLRARMEQLIMAATAWYTLLGRVS